MKNSDERGLLAGYPDLLTTELVAQLTGQSVQTVRRLCRQGRIPARRIGPRRWYVPRDRLVQFLMEDES